MGFVDVDVTQWHSVAGDHRGSHLGWNFFRGHRFLGDGNLRAPGPQVVAKLEDSSSLVCRASTHGEAPQWKSDARVTAWAMEHPQKEGSKGHA